MISFIDAKYFLLFNLVLLISIKYFIVIKLKFFLFILPLLIWKTLIYGSFFLINLRLKQVTCKVNCLFCNYNIKYMGLSAFKYFR